MKRTVFQYWVPVHVEVEDGIVTRVILIDEAPISNPTLVEGDDLEAAVDAAENGQAWPSWEFGY